MNISEKLKSLISQFFAYCLLLAGSSLVGIAIWTHAHAATPIANNTLAIHSNTKAIASSGHISRDIRKISKNCVDMERRLDNKRDQKTQIMISPYRDDPAVIELREKLEHEIRDLERDIADEKGLLHEAELKEDQLIASRAAA